MLQYAKKIAARFVEACGVMLRGQHYDNATTTVENKRHWQNAKDNPPIVNNDPATRAKLRARARYEVANNCYAAGLCSTLATDTIGYVAPVPLVSTGDNKLNTFLEGEWKTWSEAPVVNLPEKLFTLDFSRRTDGESFQLSITDTDETENQTGYALNLVIIPQARVTDNTFFTRGEVETRTVERNGYQTQVSLLNDDGVVVNTLTGFPHEFWVSNVVDESRLIRSNPIQISGRYMKQWFRPTYPGQYRGVCEIGAALGLFAQLRRFGLATLSAAEIAAMLTAILKTTLPMDGNDGPAPLAPFSTREFERNMITAMPDGWDLYQMKAEHPISNYEMFVNMVLREIGRLLDVPFGIVAGDHSKYNYSSARLDVTGYDERKKYDRSQLAIRNLNPLHREWILEVAKRRPDVEQAIKNGYGLSWKYTNRPSIDPLKDAQVEDMRLRNGTTTYSEIYAFRGMDYREQFKQRQKENEEMAEFKLNFSDALANTGKTGIMEDKVPTDVQPNVDTGLPV